MPADETPVCGKCGTQYCPPERCIFHSPVEAEVAPPVECEAPEPKASRDAQFVAKTWLELNRLTLEIALIRRGMPGHRVCADAYPCSYCIRIRDRHRMINDHIEQLEAAAVEVYEAEFEASA